jgi:GNAT superfamily N-acetyltransferase
MPSTTTTEVRVLRPGDEWPAAALLARGFAEEPGNVALLPDLALREQVLERGARTILRSTIPYGTAHVATVGGELAAIALWHPPGVPVTTVAGVLRGAADRVVDAPVLVRAAPHAVRTMLREAPEAVAMMRARSRAVRRASHGVSWHLAFLATAPEHRGRGLARQLLDRQLTRCDEDLAAAWLETTDPVNPPIYERFGFTVVHHVADAAWLPGLWVMRREPAAGGQQ